MVPGNDLRRDNVLRMFFRNEKGCTDEFNDRLNWLMLPVLQQTRRNLESALLMLLKLRKAKYIT